MVWVLLSRVDHVPRDRRASGVPRRRGRRTDIRMQRRGTRHADRSVRSGYDRRHTRTAAACAVTDTRAGPGTTVTAGTFTTGHAEAACSADAATTDSAGAAAQHGQAVR